MPSSRVVKRSSFRLVGFSASWALRTWQVVELIVCQFAVPNLIRRLNSQILKQQVVKYVKTPPQTVLTQPVIAIGSTAKIFLFICQYTDTHYLRGGSHFFLPTHTQGGKNWEELLCKRLLLSIYHGYNHDTMATLPYLIKQQIKQKWSIGLH